MRLIDGLIVCCETCKSLIEIEKWDIYLDPVQDVYWIQCIRCESNMEVCFLKQNDSQLTAVRDIV